MFGCPHNFLRTQPDPGLCAALCAWVALQAGLLLTQHAWGPRWFVPRRLRPRKHNYHGREAQAVALAAAGDGVDSEAGEGGQSAECVICMGSISSDSPPRDVMVTPCGHLFHQPCLGQWMEIKMECPTCRQALPHP